MPLREHEPKGIEGRVRLLRDMLGKSIRDPEVSRFFALQITHGAPWRDDRAELERIWWFMHKNIRYTGDVAGYDTFQTARRTLQYGGGDCDDGSVLIGALCMGNGFDYKMRITRNEKNGPWAHIYGMVGIPKMSPTRWFPMDWTLGFNRFGAHPPQGGHLEFDAHQIVYSPTEIVPREGRGAPEYRGW